MNPPGPASSNATYVPLSDEEARVLDHIDDAAMIANLLELMTVPSVGGTDAEVEIQHVLAGQLSDIGLATDLWALDLPVLAAEKDFPGIEVDRSEAWGLVGASAPGETGALVLQGHVDVVPAGDQAAWPSDPFRPLVVGDTVAGRGACDMKAGVAAIVAAAAAVQRSGLALSRGYAVHFCVGEEDGGLGAFGTLQRGHTGDACIISEPTNLKMVTASAGALTFRLEVPGRAAHGSTAYVGSSAIDSYLGLHVALRRLAERRNRDPEPVMAQYPVPYPLSVGRLSSGDWASTVPDRLVAEGRYGLRVEEDPATARRELEDAVLEASAADPYLREHPVVVTWPGGQFRGGQLPVGHALGNQVASAHRTIAGQFTAPELGVPYGSDQRLYSGAGVPTLLYGPGDVRLAHSPREAVPVQEVLSAARVLTLSVLRACR